MKKIIFIIAVLLMLFLFGCTDDFDDVSSVESIKITPENNTLLESNFELAYIEIFTATPKSLDLDPSDDALIVILELNNSEMKSYSFETGRKTFSATLNAELYSTENGELIEKWENIQINTFRRSLAGDFPVFILEFSKPIQESNAKIEITLNTKDKQFSVKRDYIWLSEVKEEDLGITKSNNIAYVETSFQSKNWDADADMDGLIGTIYFFGENPKPFKGLIKTRLFDSVDNSLLGTWETPFLERDFELNTYISDGLGNDSIKLEFKIEYSEEIKRKLSGRSPYSCDAKAIVEMIIDGYNYLEEINCISTN